MSAGPIPIYPLLAVHIADGVLTWPWLAGGFVLAGLLAAVAMIRVRDEEIPRIALMTAAFFVASLIHVPIGPTSVHLLLNGLLGVVIGRRAPLAVLLGVTLQAILLGHGGFTTIGVNTCVMALPALGAAWLFGVSRNGTRWTWFRSGLVVVSVVLWAECLVFSVALFCLSAGTSLNGFAWAGAAAVALHPITLTAAGLLGAAAAFLERRFRHASEFPAGLLVGMAAVLGTLILAAAVLLLGGADDWHSVVLLLFIAHMPIMAVEGAVLGFAVGFLARVKPEMLGGFRGGAAVSLPPPALLLFALLGVLWAATPAQAHRLDAGYTVRTDGQIQVESWFDIGGQPPAGAKVQVFRPNGDLLTEGSLDDNGVFVFRPQGAEDLRVAVSAGAGHRAEFVVSKGEMLPAPTDATAPSSTVPPPRPKPLIPHTSQLDWKDIVTGLAFLLGLAAFVLSLRNLRRLRELKAARQSAVPPPNDNSSAGTPNDHFSAGKTSSSGTSH